MASGSGRLVRRSWAASSAATTARSSSSRGSGTAPGWPHPRRAANRYRRPVADLPPVELRSDTMTRPTPAMRRAMAEAEVGDDGWGEDPTVPAPGGGLRRPPGQGGGGVPAVGHHGQPGRPAHAGRPGHAGGRGAPPARRHVRGRCRRGQRQLPAPHRRRPRPAASIWPTAREAIAGDVGHSPPVRRWWPWRTPTWCPGGRPCRSRSWTPSVALGPAVHLDGARLFNAEVALGVPVARLAAAATTVTCCLSKGLGAPVGSLLAGAGRRDRGGPAPAPRARGPAAAGRDPRRGGAGGVGPGRRPPRRGPRPGRGAWPTRWPSGSRAPRPRDGRHERGDLRS